MSALHIRGIRTAPTHSPYLLSGESLRENDSLKSPEGSLSNGRERSGESKWHEAEKEGSFAAESALFAVANGHGLEGSGEELKI